MNLRKIKFQLHWRLREFFERLHLLFNKDIVLIYTMGKVGSSSIYCSLKRILKGKVMFTHRMNKKSIKEYNTVFLKNNRKPHRTKIGELVLTKMKSKNVKIITLIREPIGRNISDFFQDLPVYFENSNAINTYDNPFILNQFMLNYPHNIPLNWFQDEFFVSTKINVFDIPFNTEKKFCVITNKNIELLIIRLDLEDEKKEQLIKQFLDLNEFKIEKQNVASKKYYFEKYNSILNTCRFNEAYISKMYNSKFCKHFYSKNEIEKMKIKFQ